MFGDVLCVKNEPDLSAFNASNLASYCSLNIVCIRKLEKLDVVVVRRRQTPQIEKKNLESHHRCGLLATLFSWN